MKKTGSTPLLAGCRAGNAAAWARLFSAWAGRIYRWAVLLGLSPADAEEASQDVLATAARRIEDCRDEAAIGVWLYQITRRVVANRRRLGWVRRVWLAEEQPEPAFENTGSASTEEELSVRACLASLSRGHAEVLVMMDVEGFTRDETAQILALPPGTVASRLRKARQSFESHWHADNPAAFAGSVPATMAMEERV